MTNKDEKASLNNNDETHPRVLYKSYRSMSICRSDQSVDLIGGSEATAAETGDVLPLP
jgi:hypothetical protein